MVKTAPHESFGKVPPEGMWNRKGGPSGGTFPKLSCGAVFTMCSHTFYVFVLFIQRSLNYLGKSFPFYSYFYVIHNLIFSFPCGVLCLDMFLNHSHHLVPQICSQTFNYKYSYYIIIMDWMDYIHWAVMATHTINQVAGTVTSSAHITLCFANDV